MRDVTHKLQPRLVQMLSLTAGTNNVHEAKRNQNFLKPNRVYVKIKVNGANPHQYDQANNNVEYG